MTFKETEGHSKRYWIFSKEHFKSGNFFLAFFSEFFGYFMCMVKAFHSKLIKFIAIGSETLETGEEPSQYFFYGIGNVTIFNERQGDFKREIFCSLSLRKVNFIFLCLQFLSEKLICVSAK